MRPAASAYALALAISYQAKTPAMGRRLSFDGVENSQISPLPWCQLNNTTDNPTPDLIMCKAQLAMLEQAGCPQMNAKTRE